MHCCPAGYAMIGARTDQNVFKCAPLVDNTGAVQLDTSTQRNGMHACPYGQVMVGLDVDANNLACQALPANTITTERVDTGTRDEYPIHVCDAAPIPGSAMSGINIGDDLQTCAGNPLLAD
jgi:hypothetical protein